MVRKININGQEYIGNGNVLLSRYIVGKVLKGIEGVSKEEVNSLCKVTISKEEARNLLCLDDKKITAMVAELYPNVDEEDYEDISRDLIDEIIVETFKGLMTHTETFYENGANCMVSVISGIVFKKDIEIELSPKYMEFYIKSSNNKFHIVSLADTEKLKSVNSIKLYTRLMYELSKFENNKMPKKVSISLENLKSTLHVHGDKYEKYGDFKRRILATSINEINQLDYNVNFNEIKEGKKVVAIEFEINNQ